MAFAPRTIAAIICAALFGSLSISVANAEQIRIVALGDSNFGAPGVSRDQAYPAQLERALRARGIDATVVNAGVNGDTTDGVLARMDSDVPQGTDVVLVSIGINDIVVHHASPASVQAHVAQIVGHLRGRGIEVVLLPTGKAFQGSIGSVGKYHVEATSPEQTGPAPGSTMWHLKPEGYAMVVARTLPQVVAAVERARKHHKS